MKKILILVLILALYTMSFKTEKQRSPDPFKTDFESYISTLNSFKTTTENHGDTTAAYNSLYAAINNLYEKYDVSHEWLTAKQRWPQAAAYCVAGCAKWYYDCSHPYPGIEAVFFCITGYNDCLDHCSH